MAVERSAGQAAHVEKPTGLGRLGTTLADRTGWPPTTAQVPVRSSRADGERPGLGEVVTFHVESPVSDPSLMRTWRLVVASPAQRREGTGNRADNQVSRFAVVETDRNPIRRPAAARSRHGRTSADPRRRTRLDVNTGRCRGYGASDRRDFLVDLTSIGDGVIKAQGDPESESDRQKNQRDEKPLSKGPGRYSSSGTFHGANSIVCAEFERR